MEKKDRFKRKNVLFDPDNPEDVKLLQRLARLPYGEFSGKTKELWRKELRRVEREGDNHNG